MAFLKTGHAAIVTPQACPGKWMDKKVSNVRYASAKKVIGSYDPNKWLLSHATIIASVDTDFADPNDPNSRYYISPHHSPFVNNNGDSWERGLLKSCYKTFLGADNFVEHVQIPELSKGKVIDVALREVVIGQDAQGKDITTLYVDILVATNRVHEDLIQKILNNEYNAMSMGCKIAYSICTKCGNKAVDDTDACKHIRYFKNNYFYDANGIRRIIAELCGSEDDPDSCAFIDASWVRKPAFEGAVKRNIILPNEDVSDKLNKSILVPSFKPDGTMFLKAASDQASALVKELEAAEGDEPAAEAPAAEAPKDDIDFPEAPKDTEGPLDEGGSEESAPPEDESATPAEGPALDPGTPNTGDVPGPQIEEPTEDATLKEVKDMMKKHLLNQMRKELLLEQAEEQGIERPLVNETYSNQSLVKDANMDKLNRVLVASKKFSNDKLRNGIMILSNLKNWDQFKKYGYSRNDTLGLLYHIDRTLSEAPIGMDMVKALTKVKLASNNLKGFFTEIIVESGRKPQVNEAKKLVKWARILSRVE